MQKEIVVVGGGPGGVITALTAKSVYPDKSVCVIREIGDGVIPCAIPYMINTMEDPKSNMMPMAGLESAGIESLVDEVISLDAEKKCVKLKGGDTVEFDRLVLATGSQPANLPIPGSDLKGVFTVIKSLDALNGLVEKAKSGHQRRYRGRRLHRGGVRRRTGPKNRSEHPSGGAYAQAFAGRL